MKKIMGYMAVGLGMSALSVASYMMMQMKKEGKCMCCNSCFKAENNDEN